MGLLAANATWPSFDDIVDQLLRMSLINPFTMKECDKSRVVHGHNCLRELFRSSIITGLGNKAEKWLSKAFKVAATSIRSDM